MNTKKQVSLLNKIYHDVYDSMESLIKDDPSSIFEIREAKLSREPRLIAIALLYDGLLDFSEFLGDYSNWIGIGLAENVARWFSYVSIMAPINYNYAGIRRFLRLIKDNEILRAFVAKYPLACYDDETVGMALEAFPSNALLIREKSNVVSKHPLVLEYTMKTNIDDYLLLPLHMRNSERIESMIMHPDLNKTVAISIIATNADYFSRLPETLQFDMDVLRAVISSEEFPKFSGQFLEKIIKNLSFACKSETPVFENSKSEN